MIIRPMTVFEREAVRKFLLDLPPEDRRNRFCSTLSDAAVSAYVDGLDFVRDTILGAFDDAAQLVGLAELVPGTEESEMAFAVRPDKRGQKVGTRLMDRLLQRARICGVRKAVVLFLANNTPMHKLASRAGMHIRSGDGDSFGERNLRAPNPIELAQWFLEEEFAHGGHFTTLNIARWRSLVTGADTTPPRLLKALSAGPVAVS
jgi:GNAT superfamily N-acetyltransferase